MAQMAARLDRDMPPMTAADVMAAAADPTLVVDLRPPERDVARGPAVPDTYQVSNGETPGPGRRADGRPDGARRSARRTSRPRRRRSAESPYQILIVASMIEREAKIDEDRQDRPGHLQPAVPSACRCRSTPRCCYGTADRRRSDASRSPAARDDRAVQHLPAHRACRRRRSPTPAGRRSRPRSTRRRTRSVGDPLCADLPQGTRACTCTTCSPTRTAATPSRSRPSSTRPTSQRGPRRRPARRDRRPTHVAAVIGIPSRTACRRRCTTPASRRPGVDWVYVAFEVAPGAAGAALDAMRTLGLGGLSVTMPHKEDVAAAVDVLDPAAAALRSGQHGRARSTTAGSSGHSTDGAGFVASLPRPGVDRRRRRVSWCSAPAPRRAASSTRSAAPARPTSPSSTARATRPTAAAALAGDGGASASPATSPTADIVVNATSVGMGTDRAAARPGAAATGQVVADLVYHPLRDGAAGRRPGRRRARRSTGSACWSTRPCCSSSCGPASAPDPAVMRAAAERRAGIAAGQ